MAKSLFEEANYNDIRSRIENLKVDNRRQWGKMELAQMLTHCNLSLEQAMGKIPFVDESNFFLKTVIKWLVLRMIRKGKLGRNSPTSKVFVVADVQVFDKEKKRLLENIKEFQKKDLATDLRPHPSFGAWTNEQWGTLQYLHLDHHLQQFSA
jgi:hypothetical protein